MRYLHVIYWSLGMLTGLVDGHRPVSAVEGLYTILVFVVGTFLFAYTIGVLGSIDEMSEESKLQFQAKMQSVRMSLAQHKLPAGIRSRILNFYSYQYERNKGADDMALLGELPDELQSDIMLHLTESVLRRVHFFADSEHCFLAALAKVTRTPLGKAFP